MGPEDTPGMGAELGLERTHRVWGLSLVWRGHTGYGAGGHQVWGLSLVWRGHTGYGAG